MMNRLQNLWEILRTSFWFIPSVMAIVAVGMSFLFIELDRQMSAKIAERLGVIYSGGADGARAVLEAIAGSMITVAGVVFSITMVALSLASQQFGPRLLRTFTSDRANQFVLGVFVSTFLYCLLVLRTVRGTDYGDFVPYLSVTFGILLAVMSLAVLIFFVHHVASRIQVSNITASVSEELDALIERLYPDPIGIEPPAPEEHDEARDRMRGEPVVLHAPSSGYLQMIDPTKIMRTASKNDLVVKILRRPGDYLMSRSSLMQVWAASEISRAVEQDLIAAFLTGAQRTSTQDIGFLVLQLAEVAIRSLSPGINDPFTAIESLDRLGSSLQKLVCRSIPSAERLDDAGHIRVIAEPVRLPELAATGFDRIRHYAQNNPFVLSHMASVIGTLALSVERAEDRTALVEQLHHIRATANSLDEAWLRDRVEDNARSAYDALFKAAR